MKQVNGVKIDGPCLRILKVLNNSDDCALNTSEAKTLSGISDNDIVRRRFAKLEEAGLANLSTDTSVDAHHIAPKLCELTSEGIETAEATDFTVINDLEGERDKLVRVEQRLNQVEERVYRIEQKCESDVSDLGIEQTRLLVSAMQGYLAEELNADLGKYAQ